MITSPAQLYAAAVAALGAALGEPWFHSAHGPDDFSEARDGAERAHASFCVWLPTSSPSDTRQRRRGEEAFPFHSELRVRYLYRIRPLQRATDYAAALEAEAVLLRTILDAPTIPTFHAILAEPITRTELPGDTGHLLLGEMAFNLPHSILVE